MKVSLVRHTAVDVPRGICYGQTDVPLCDTFERESSAVVHKLKHLSPDAVYSSPLSRCTRLAAQCGYTDIILSDELKEANFGDWEMKAWDKIDMSVWAADGWKKNPPPGGESLPQMICRVSDFFDRLKQKPFRSVVIFTHGGVFGCVRVYLGLNDINSIFDTPFGYGAVWEFTL